MRIKPIRNTEYIHIDFDKVWRYVPANRPRKEHLKWILFSIFPFLFRRFEVFQNWKSARIFEDKAIGLRSSEFWRRKLLQRYEIKFGNNHAYITENDKQENKLAVVIHAFYPDVLEEIILKLQNCVFDFKLFVTAPESVLADVKAVLDHNSYEYFLLKVENRGRDVLPFLLILKNVFYEGYTLVLKIHTKRSNHLNKKELWSNDLFNKMLGNENMKNILQTFYHHKELGMIGPSGHILPMSFYYGANATTVEMLGRKMGLQGRHFSNLHFVAGTMFYARKEALLPLLSLNLNETDFEEEAGQLDGTMAHAVERAFACSTIAAGMYLADSSSKPDSIACIINMNHSFTL
jgi:lipopolysaccharide biosynthesis protein